MVVASVPARVTAPVVAVLGVNPVVPALNVVTPPLPDELMVWLGHVPLMVTFVPATKAGVDVPVPPFATGKRPVTPVVNGRPVKLVATPDVGVPKIGVTSVGEVDNTLLPEPVDVVTPVPPLATGSVPVTPVVKGKPVRLVATPEVGVPKMGVTNVGLVANATTVPVPVVL